MKQLAEVSALSLLLVLVMAQFKGLFLHMHGWPVGKTGKHDSFFILNNVSTH